MKKKSWGWTPSTPCKKSHPTPPLWSSSGRQAWTDSSWKGTLRWDQGFWTFHFSELKLTYSSSSPLSLSHLKASCSPTGIVQKAFLREPTSICLGTLTSSKKQEFELAILKVVCRVFHITSIISHPFHIKWSRAFTCKSFSLRVISYWLQSTFKLTLHALELKVNRNYHFENLAEFECICFFINPSESHENKCCYFLLKLSTQYVF